MNVMDEEKRKIHNTYMFGLKTLVEGGIIC